MRFDSNIFETVAVGTFHKCALLSLSHLKCGENHVIFSGGTSGVIYASNLTSFLSKSPTNNNNNNNNNNIHPFVIQPFHSIQAHQCGVNNIQLAVDEQNQYWLVSVGDDQKLFVCKFSLDVINGNEVKLVEKFSKSVLASNASLTSLFVSQNRFIFCCGIEQRLSIWKVEDSEKCLQLVFNCIVDVPDVSSISVHEQSNHQKVSKFTIFIGGNGLQIVELNLKN